MILVIECGCAECYSSADPYPLINIRKFESVEAAKAFYEPQGWLRRGIGEETRPIPWESHPQGGEQIISGQGSIWILPEDVKGIKELDLDG